jgi:hypothetical protein
MPLLASMDRLEKHAQVATAGACSLRVKQRVKDEGLIAIGVSMDILYERLKDADMAQRGSITRLSWEMMQSSPKLTH